MKTRLLPSLCLFLLLAAALRAESLSLDGANLPFSFDITPHTRRAAANILVLEVDNSYDDTTIPGSRPGNGFSHQVYPWWNFGGIPGSVALESEPAAPCRPKAPPTRAT